MSSPSSSLPSSSPAEAYDRARQLIDAAHARDPAGAEQLYADAVEKWVKVLVPSAPPLLQLAARSQHLERYLYPRSSYAEGKVGYLSWRRSLYVVQAGRARELLLEAGVVPDEADAVYRWVAKENLLRNPEQGTQALEDGAVLVFLESEMEKFAKEHGEEHSREKFVEIVKKSWRKLSPRAQEVAKEMVLPGLEEGLRGIVEDATRGEAEKGAGA